MGAWEALIPPQGFAQFCLSCPVGWGSGGCSRFLGCWVSHDGFTRSCCITLLLLSVTSSCCDFPSPSPLLFTAGQGVSDPGKEEFSPSFGFGGAGSGWKGKGGSTCELVSSPTACWDLNSEHSKHRDISHNTFFSNPAAVLDAGMCAL